MRTGPIIPLNVIRRPGVTFLITAADISLFVLIGGRLGAIAGQFLDDPERPIGPFTMADVAGILSAIVLFIALTFCTWVVVRDTYKLILPHDDEDYLATKSAASFGHRMFELFFSLGAIGIPLIEPALTLNNALNATTLSAGGTTLMERVFENSGAVALAVLITIGHVIAAYVTALRLCAWSRDVDIEEATKAIGELETEKEQSNEDVLVGPIGRTDDVKRAS